MPTDEERHAIHTRLARETGPTSGRPEECEFTALCLSCNFWESIRLPSDADEKQQACPGCGRHSLIIARARAINWDALVPDDEPPLRSLHSSKASGGFSRADIHAHRVARTCTRRSSDHLARGLAVALCEVRQVVRVLLSRLCPEVRAEPTLRDTQGAGPAGRACQREGERGRTIAPKKGGRNATRPPGSQHRRVTSNVDAEF